jgi:hypothetical protein
MIGLVSALRVLGGDLHNYGFDLLPAGKSKRVEPRLNFFWRFLARARALFVASRRSSR